MRVLAIDTTGPRESVAVVEGSTVRGEVRLEALDAHSRRVMPAIAFLLDTLGLGPLDLDGYAVSAGPGSFTGVRVGISTVQGLALAAGRPCLAVSTLDALAERARGLALTVVAMIDAFRDEVYGSVHDQRGQRLGPATVGPPSRLLATVPAGAAFIGDGAERYRARILEHDPTALFASRSLFLAGTVGLLAVPLFERGESVSAKDLRPIYLREADIRPSLPAAEATPRR
jgi:tRNA threonylcarbamoyladenosine biosynthesis protein TsaB